MQREWPTAISNQWALESTHLQTREQAGNHQILSNTLQNGKTLIFEHFFPPEFLSVFVCFCLFIQRCFDSSTSSSTTSKLIYSHPMMHASTYYLRAACYWNIEMKSIDFIRSINTYNSIAVYIDVDAYRVIK